VLTIAIGIAAATITSLASIPQLVKTWKTKRADDLSYGLLAFLLLGISLWLLYGFLVPAVPIIIESVVSLASICAITVLKVRYAGASWSRR
jgi:MtN3 and saliva related transmembrane protein